MKNLIGLISDKPWIVVAAMTILFFVSLGRLIYKQSRRKRAFNMIKDMRNNRDLSKVYLRMDNGYGDFYDVSVSMDSEIWHRAVFTEDLLTPAILLPPGKYELKFFVKSRSGVSPYHSKKGAFHTEVIVEPFIDTMIVFDNDTLASWQEDYKEEN